MLDEATVWSDPSCPVLVELFELWYSPDQLQCDSLNTWVSPTKANFGKALHDGVVAIASGAANLILELDSCLFSFLIVQSTLGSLSLWYSYLLLNLLIILFLLLQELLQNTHVVVTIIFSQYIVEYILPPASQRWLLPLLWFEPSVEPTPIRDSCPMHSTHSDSYILRETQVKLDIGL